MKSRFDWTWFLAETAEKQKKIDFYIEPNVSRIQEMKTKNIQLNRQAEYDSISFTRAFK